MLEPRVVNQLRDIVGAQRVSTDRVWCSYDPTQQQFLPDVVAHPGTSNEIAQILDLANAEAGARLSQGGGQQPHGRQPADRRRHSVRVTRRLSRILRIDDDHLAAEVEPGAVTEQFQQEVEKVGLFHPPHPASLKFSTSGIEVSGAGLVASARPGCVLQVQDSINHAGLSQQPSHMLELITRSLAKRKVGTNYPTNDPIS